MNSDYSEETVSYPIESIPIDCFTSETPDKQFTESVVTGDVPIKGIRKLIISDELSGLVKKDFESRD